MIDLEAFRIGFVVGFLVGAAFVWLVSRMR